MPTLPTKTTRKVGNFQFVAGGRDSLRLDTDGVVTRLLIRIKFSVTSGSSAMVGPLFQTLARLIKKVDIEVNGRDVIQTQPGWMLAAEAFVANKLPAYGMDSTVVLTGSTTTTAYDVILPVYLDNPLGRRRDDTALDMAGLSQVVVRCEFGTIADLVATTNSATVTVSEMTLAAEHMINYRRGTAANGAPQPLNIRHIDWIEDTITATSPAHEITVDNKTGLFIQSLFVFATVNDVANDSVINALTLKQGNFIHGVWDAPVLRAMNREQFGISVGTFASFPLTGMYYIDPRYDGQMINGIDTRPEQMPSDLKLALDVTLQSGTNKVFVRREGWRNLML